MKALRALFILMPLLAATSALAEPQKQWKEVTTFSKSDKATYELASDACKEEVKKHSTCDRSQSSVSERGDGWSCKGFCDETDGERRAREAAGG